jgi:hypothetical protein
MEINDSFVTEENYRDIHAYLENQIEHFLINRENWILSEFNHIPANPSPESIDALRNWICTYLPRSTQRDLLARFAHQPMNHALSSHKP